MTHETQVEPYAVEFQVSVAATFGTLGYLLWSLRGGILLTAALSHAPMWRFIDPLPILDQYVSSSPNTQADHVENLFDE